MNMNKHNNQTPSVSPAGYSRKKGTQASDCTPQGTQLRRSARNISPAGAAKTTASNFGKNVVQQTPTAINSFMKPNDKVHSPLKASLTPQSKQRLQSNGISESANESYYPRYSLQSLQASSVIKNPDQFPLTSVDHGDGKKLTAMWGQQPTHIQKSLRGFEAMAGVQKIHLKELVDREPAKTGALAKPERRRRSKKANNTASLDEQKKVPVYSQSAIGKGASTAGLAQTLAAEAHSSGSALHLSNEQFKSLQSGSIKKPTLSTSFYLNATQLQQAYCQPFESQIKGETDLSETEQAKCKLLRLLGNKKKRDVLNSEMQKMRAQINPQEIDCKQAPTIEVQEFDVASSEPLGELVPEPAVMASRNGKQSVRVTGLKSKLRIDQSTPTPKQHAMDKCPSTVSSYVGGFLAPQNVKSADRRQNSAKQHITEMANNLKNLDPAQIEKITGFAQQVKAIRHIKQIYNENENKEPALQLDGEATPDQVKYLKSIPKQELQRMGFGDLDFEASEDFLSESSFSEGDFQLLMKDNFFEIMQDIQNDISKKDDQKQKTEKHNSVQSKKSLHIEDADTQSAYSGCSAFKMPKYDSSLSYDTEFYNLFIQNQNLLEKVEIEAKERNDTLMQIFRIQDYYDRNVAKLKAERYESGRKIHERRKMKELERDQPCPYEGCGRSYASEGSLNLHIKGKHNGGNKTDREKLAKSLVYCKAKGITIPDQLEVNLPPGIVKKAAEQIKQMSNIEIQDTDLCHLEEKLHVQNRAAEKKMKQLELQKAQEESERAKQMVGAGQCTPPKKSKHLKNFEMYKKTASNSNGRSPIESEFLEPLPITRHPRKAQKVETFDSQAPSESVLVDRTNTQSTMRDVREMRADPKRMLQKQFSFADPCDEKIDQKVASNKRTTKATRKQYGQENQGPVKSRKVTDKNDDKKEDKKTEKKDDDRIQDRDMIRASPGMWREPSVR